MDSPIAYIFIDASNIHYYLNNEGWKIDWTKFKTHCNQAFKASRFFYYDGMISKGCYFDNNPNCSLQDFIIAKQRKKNYFKLLRQINYKVRHKPVTRIYDKTEGKYKHKCNFDVELTIDAIDNINNYDIFILVSGDGDFEKLIKYLKGRWKKTVVIAPRDRLSDKLKKSANIFIHLDTIKNSIIK
jgi:uncharacterized LabA/DUF88 family protein